MKTDDTGKRILSTDEDVIEAIQEDARKLTVSNATVVSWHYTSHFAVGKIKLVITVEGNRYYKIVDFIYDCKDQTFVRFSHFGSYIRED